MYGLDFPYVKRATREQIKSNPALATLDRDNIFEACERFKTTQLVFSTFWKVRVSLRKHQQRNSKYTHLLSPKIGGASYVLEAMHDHLDSILDITIYYPEGVPTFWDFLSGKIKMSSCKLRTFRFRSNRGLQALITSVRSNHSLRKSGRKKTSIYRISLKNHSYHDPRLGGACSCQHPKFFL